ncbi:hypothetical protein [Pricia sp.]|uniref:hypothetical protein n=1 Tax=Pricia sp. TaxID=2268138 RepID=UPI0035935711
MKKFILKSALYVFLILLLLEGIVRVLHLYTEDPPRFIDDYGVEKRVPDNSGYAVTGNRNQNFSEFHINKAGFNSHREFEPGRDKYEVALIGDSFIEGFHQDYDSSTGKRVEEKVKGIEVYEYGYAGYDFANQLHLVNAYATDFELIDEIILYLNYENDLGRGIYEPNHARIKMLSSTLFRLRDNIKLLAYGSKIGIVEPLKKLAQGGDAFDDTEDAYKTNAMNGETDDEKREKDEKRIANFKSLIALYGLDKDKTAILLDSRKTSKRFLDFLDENGIRYIDFAERFEKSEKSTNLIYDHHWNAHGRELISEEIAGYINKVEKR